MARKRKKVKSEFTTAEAVSLIYGDGSWKIRGVPRVNMQPIRLSDGPSGLRKVENDTLTLNECATSIAYPTSAMLACSFDRDLMERYGKAIAKECRENDVDVILAPGVNIKRNPLCGRNFEYYSEDPYVSGSLAASFIKGVQSLGVGACLKHFACNSQESFRMVTNSIVDQRALHEIYLRAFEFAIKEAKPWALMASYNRVNGQYACENSYLLKDILREKWKYDGVVISDWGGVNDPILSHENGLDVEMPCYTNRTSWYNRTALARKEFAKAAQESAVRIETLASRVHNPDIKVPSFSLDEGHNLAVKMAEQSFVLVRNEKNILPLSSLRDVAIIGELAEKPRIGGNGSSQVKGYHLPSFIDYCKQMIGPENVSYSKGYSLTNEGDAVEMTLDALELASKSGLVLYFMGTALEEESEGFDRHDMRLSEKQTDLFNRILDVNPHVVVVLYTGAPVETSFLEKASAGFVGYFPGEGGSEALFNLLTGKANPSGHLAETWPMRNYEVPSFGFYPGTQVESQYRESIYVGYRYYLTAGEEVSMPFGYGLSYSTFEYSKLTLSSKTFSAGDKLKVSVTVKNTSNVAGYALVQLYISPRGGVVFKAKRTLQGFKKVFLEPGAKEVVEIELNRRAFEHYDTRTKAFQIEGDEYIVEIGENCEKILLRAYVDVLSDMEFEKVEIPVYNNPPRDGFWQYDDAFEDLLGHVLPILKDPRNRPYTINSTFRNIESTFVGKKVISRAESNFRQNKENVNIMMTIFLDMPIRSLVLAGMKEKYAQVIVDLANRKPFAALWHCFFRKRVGK